MVKPLRTLHFAVWTLLTIVVMITFVLAVSFRPGRMEEQRNADNFLFTATRKDSSLQISIQVLNPLTTPSCLVYAQEADRKILLGKLGARGKYVFSYSVGAKSIQLFDGIHNKEIVAYLIPNDL